MFVKIDKSQLPLIKINFGNNIKSFEEIYPFFDIWYKMYEEKQNFTFMINTLECGKIPIKYIYDIAQQISKIKKLEKQYLERTIVIIQSKWIKNLMLLLFKIVKPIAPIYIVKEQKTFQELYNRLQNNQLKSDLEYDFLDSK